MSDNLRAALWKFKLEQKKKEENLEGKSLKNYFLCQRILNTYILMIFFSFSNQFSEFRNEMWINEVSIGTA